MLLFQLPVELCFHDGAEHVTPCFSSQEAPQSTPHPARNLIPVFWDLCPHGFCKNLTKNQAEETKRSPAGSKIWVFPLAHIACQTTGPSQYSGITVLGGKKIEKKKEEREGKI